MKIKRLLLLSIALGLAAAGSVTVAEDEPAGTGMEVTSKSNLAPFTGCVELKRYLVTNALTQARLEQQMGGVPYSPIVIDNPSSPPEPAPEGAGLDYSSTNVQERDVDEPDIVQTDGDYLYLINGEHLVIVQSWPPEDSVEVSRTVIEGDASGLLFHDDMVMVFSRVWDYGPSTAPMPMIPGATKMTLLDVSDRSAPQRMREVLLEGDYNTARLAEGRVHMVISAHLPVYDYGPMPGGPVAAGSGSGMDSGARLSAALGQYGRSLVAMEVGDLVPKMADRVYHVSGKTLEIGAISECDSFYHPTVPNGSDTISVVTLDLADPLGEIRTSTVVSNNGTVYASTNSLYMATINADAWYWWEPAAGGPVDTSVIHKFSLGEVPEYQASGKVPGWIVNRYAMSEYEDVFRIATTTDMWNVAGSGPINTLFTLQQEGEELTSLGQLDGLGHEGERIYAVRFDGERGYIVTFRQTDPLYTLDLSDPAAPAVVGELEIPGFSTYIHPIEGDRLLSIGQNTDKGGVDLSMYDVSDPAAPAIMDREWLGSYSWSSALYEPHAFTYFAPLNRLAVPLTIYPWSPVPEGAEYPPGFNGAVLFDVDEETGLTEQGRVDHADFVPEDPWFYYADVQRSLFIGDQEEYGLYTVSFAGVKVNDAEDLTATLATVPLPAQQDWWPAFF